MGIVDLKQMISKNRQIYIFTWNTLSSYSWPKTVSNEM
jgi:hypothetical protein